MRPSPLFGTAIVMVVLGLLAIPLRDLTGSDRALPPAAGGAAGVSAASDVGDSTPAVARLRLLREALSIELRSDDDKLLWKAAKVSAGETEAEIPLVITDGGAVLRLCAEFAGDGAETAVFVSVFPDGLEERSAHAIGGASINDRLVYRWPNGGHEH